MQALKRLTRKMGLVCACAVVVLWTGGCVVHRGKDFGSYLGTGEQTKITQVYNVEKAPHPNSKQTIVLLPLLGNMTASFSTNFQAMLVHEAQRYFEPRIVMIRPGDMLAEYAGEENIAPNPGFIYFNEVSHLGKLLGVDYILIVWVRNVRIYTPQDINLYFAMVDVQTGKILGEMDAHFHAADQRVLIALEDYLQSRRARPFSRQQLDVMLQSPREYQLFVASECNRAFAEKLWP